MLADILKLPFNRAAARYRGKGCLVNYVWINKEPDAPGRQAKCSVSLKHLDCAYRNARYYPEAEFRIWLDFRFLDERSKTCLRDHAALYAPANATLCDLNDIEPYNKNALFSPNAAGAPSIWARVDFARLIVLDHVLKNETMPYAVYTDFDVADVRLRQAVDYMDRYGVALARDGASRFMPDRLNMTRSILENGYYAFRKNGKAQGLLEDLLRNTAYAAGNDENGYEQFHRLTEEWATAQDISATDAALPRVLYDMGYKIPDRRCYRRRNWN